MKGFLKVVVGVVIGGIILIVVLVLLLSAGANKAVKDIQTTQDKTAITSTQARAVKIGTPRKTILAKFGMPKDTQESTAANGNTSCIYYGIKGGQLLDSWQFCFDEQDKLITRNRF